MANISSIKLPSGDTYDIKDSVSGYMTGMTILSYGSSTWDNFIEAYNSNKVVYCRASSNANPATGSQTRLAFMAYVNNAATPTEVEFQYYRSVSSHTASQQGDQVFVYKLNKTNGWSVTKREASVKVVAGTGLGGTYSNGTMTLTGPTKVSDLTNDSGFITSYTETDPIFIASPAYGITSTDISNWNNKSDFSGDYSDLTNKPTLFSGDYDDLTSIPTELSDFVDNHQINVPVEVTDYLTSIGKDLRLKSSVVDRSNTTAPSETIYAPAFVIYDKNSKSLGVVSAAHHSNNNMNAQFTVHRDVNGTDVTNALVLSVKPDGTKSYWVTDKEAFRSDMGCNSATNLTTGTLPVARLPVLFKTISTNSSATSLNYGIGKTIKVTVPAQSGYDLVGVVGVTSNHGMASSIGGAWVSNSSNREVSVNITNRNTTSSGNFTDLVVTVHTLWAISSIY